MDPTTPTENRDSPHVEGSGTMNAIFDAIVSLLIAAAGLGMAAAGIAVYGTADTATAEEIVTDLEVTSTFMTEAELVDAIHSFMTWGGIGLAVTGAALVVVGIGFLVYSRRLRGRREGTGLVIDDRYVLAVVGAVVSAVASFVPFSPVVGGAVAGYVQRSGNGLRIGALAGAALAAPYALLLVFLAGGAFAVNAGTIGLLIVAMLALSTAITVVLSAIGGYAGTALADR